MKRAATAFLLILLASAAAFGGYRLAMHRMSPTQAAPAPAAVSAADNERKVLYWYDPMFPQHKFDKPGPSPFMDMQLVAKYAGEGGDTGSVSVSSRVAQNLGIRIGEAVAGALERRFETVGTVAWNERALVQLQARAAGFVEKLHARAPLDPVAKGAPLLELLVPSWAGAQEEYLLLRRSDSPELRALVAAARQRLILLGMAENDIAEVERSGAVQQRFTLVSPISGVIAELGVREGGAVMAGQSLFRIVDLSSVWVNAEIPEAQAGMLVPGSRVEARVPAYPGQVYSGRVGAILPEVSVATRTVRARVELANPGSMLKPGMFATLAFLSAAGEKGVLVPSEALIRTGTRNVVILAVERGGYRAAEVEVGQEAGGKAEIRKGLKAGERVVLSGQFLIDSEASLSSTLARLEGADAAAAASPPADGAHKGSGKVMAVDAKAGRIELDHGPMPSIKWPAMKMGFMVEDRALLQGLKPGDAVEFEMHGEPDKEGNYVIRKIAPGVRK
ncbi:MAG: efflux RND transporter periplasmic adaptor subunit [Betaproteobacteria bacterium]